MTDPTPAPATDDLVWIRSTVEHPGGLDEDYVAVPRAEWAAMTADQRDIFLVNVAVEHQNNVAPCGAQEIDAADVPEEFRRG